MAGGVGGGASASHVTRKEPSTHTLTQRERKKKRNQYSQHKGGLFAVSKKGTGTCSRPSEAFTAVDEGQEAGSKAALSMT